MQNFEEFLTESSLSRTLKQMQNFDSGFITAYRGVNTNAINKAANKKLITQLRAKDFGVTVVKGSYVENYGDENAKEVSEESIFVVNLSNRSDMQKIMTELGSEYNQDSILFVPKGAKQGLLIGTNDAGYPGKGNIVKLANPVFGASGEFMTRVNGRPFIFKDEPSEVIKEQFTSVSKRAIVLESKQPIEYFVEQISDNSQK